MNKFMMIILEKIRGHPSIYLLPFIRIIRKIINTFAIIHFVMLCGQKHSYIYLSLYIFQTFILLTLGIIIYLVRILNPLFLYRKIKLLLIYTVRYTVGLLKKNPILYRKVYSSKSFRVIDPQTFLSASYIYIRNYKVDLLIGLSNFLWSSGKKSHAFLVNDAAFKKFSNINVLKPYLLKWLPNDMQGYKEACKKSNDFVFKLCNALSNIKYKNIEVVELVKGNLVEEDRFFRFFAMAFRSLKQKKVEKILFVVDAAKHYFSKSLELARRLSINTNVEVIEYEYNRRNERARPVDPSSYIVNWLTYLPDKKKCEEERIVENKLRKKLEKMAQSGWYSPARWTRIFYNIVYPEYFLQEITIPKVSSGLSANGQRPVLLVTQCKPDSNYWKTMLPVLREFKKQTYPLLVLTDNPNIGRECETIGIEVVVINWGYYLKENIHNTILFHFNMQVRDLARGNSFLDKDKKEVVNWLGRELSTEEEVLFEDLLNSNIIYQNLLKGLKAVDCLERILNVLNPVSVVVMPHVNPLAKYANIVAKARGIPTISITASTVAPSHFSIVNWDMDLVAVYGYQGLESFKIIDYPERNLVVTGNPRWDSLPKLDILESQNSLSRDFGLTFDKKIILVATSHHDPAEYRWINALIDFCKERGDCVVVFKLKYGHTYDELKQIREPKSSPYFKVVESSGLQLFLSVAEVVITDWSTSGAEAALIGKPLVVVNLTGERFPTNNYDEYGIAMLVSNIDQIPKVINQILDDEETRLKLDRERKQFENQYNYLNDGRAAERVCHLMVNPKKYLNKDLKRKRRQINRNRTAPI